MRFLAVVLLVLAAPAMLCCAREAALLRGPVSPGDQVQAAVKVETECGYGTGFLVSPHLVVTAYHVTQCDGRPARQITVDPKDGKRAAAVDAAVPERDLARLRVVEDLSAWSADMTIGHAEVGERVCWAAMSPRPTYRCGTVSKNDDTGLVFDGFVEQGNSGSALYDHLGRVIGVVQGYWDCQGGVPCIGRAQSFADYAWLVP